MMVRSVIHPYLCFDHYDCSAALRYGILDVVLEHLAVVFKALGLESLH